MRRTLLHLSAAVVLALCGAGAARAEILIGAAGALTGPNAYQGEQQQQGVEMAIADLNARGGVLGEQLKLISLDDACDSGQAVAAAQRLVAAKVPFVVGHQCSGASIPAAKVYEEARVIQMTSSSTNPRLTEEGRMNVFRICGRDDQQGAIAGDYLADHWRTAKIAILSDGSVYGKGLADETRRQLNKRGIVEALHDEVTPGEIDYSSIIAKLRAAGVRTTYYGGYVREAALLARSAREQGYVMQLVSGDSNFERSVYTRCRGGGRRDAVHILPRPTPGSCQPAGCGPISQSGLRARRIYSQQLRRRPSLGPGGYQSRLARNGSRHCCTTQ